MYVSMKAILQISLISMFCISHQSFADHTSNALQVRTIAIAPYGIDNSGELSGIYYELTHSLLIKSGLAAEHHIFPYGRIIHELKLGKTDITIMFKYKELANYVDYIYPLPALKNVVIGRRGHDYQSITQLEGLNIAYLNGAKFSDAVDNNPKIHKQIVVDFHQGLLMLKKKRVDAIIGPMKPIMSAAKRLALNKGFFGKPLVVSERTPWLQLSKQSKSHISADKIKAIFSKMIDQGALENIQLKYQ
ncbi:transporter substrate-binding domain-containing protein [Colwellia demingiae]|uniref:Transporter substrate-binding domain-containing protein n=2 Tax=Colwellia demingiae TaxID=89401 RepID=A0A5C6QNE3_9GAMM|nr:transporter substrate-binding domain-containing protein [Colwellia demingiae]